MIRHVLRIALRQAAERARRHERREHAALIFAQRVALVFIEPVVSAA